MNQNEFQVRQRTGFKNVYMLLSFAIIVCQGGVDRLSDTCSLMIWYEERFAYFEFFYGKTVTTITSCAAIYIVDQRIMSRVIKSKLSSVLAARDSWPLYASLGEDIALRSNKWLGKYVGQLPIFHDNTGLLFPTPSDSYMQRLTYSSYYAGNVGKGGVFIQLCGWLGIFELYPGAI